MVDRIEEGSGRSVDYVTESIPAQTLARSDNNTTPPGHVGSVVARPGPDRGEITVAWEPPEDNGSSPLEGYNVYSTGGLLVQVGPNTTEFLHDDLGDNTTRYYSIAAFNADGEGPHSPLLQGRTFFAPTEPTDVTAVSKIPHLHCDGEPIVPPKPLPAFCGPQDLTEPPTYKPHFGEIHITWKAPNRSGGLALDSYTILRGPEPDRLRPIDTLEPTRNHYTDRPAGGPVTGDITQYRDRFCYAVQATNPVGPGDVSDPVCEDPLTDPQDFLPPDPLR